MEHIYDLDVNDIRSGLENGTINSTKVFDLYHTFRNFDKKWIEREPSEDIFTIFCYEKQNELANGCLSTNGIYEYLNCIETFELHKIDLFLRFFTIKTLVLTKSHDNPLIMRIMENCKKLNDKQWDSVEIESSLGIPVLMDSKFVSEILCHISRSKLCNVVKYNVPIVKFNFNDGSSENIMLKDLIRDDYILWLVDGIDKTGSLKK